MFVVHCTLLDPDCESGSGHGSKTLEFSQLVIYAVALPLEFKGFLFGSSVHSIGTVYCEDYCEKLMPISQNLGLEGVQKVIDFAAALFAFFYVFTADYFFSFWTIL
jgi:hypothetical protein